MSQGLLLSEEMGTGKIILMDMFFNSIPIKKRRWHHHALMLELYSRMHRMKPSVETRIDIGNEYSLLRIARDLIQEANVLAIDEFQLPDPYLHFLLNSHQRCRRNNKTSISVLLQTWRCPRRNHKSSPRRFPTRR